jgi:hypothetical protein
MDAAKVVSVEDCGPDGFRWLTLKKITVGLWLLPEMGGRRHPSFK